MWVHGHWGWSYTNSEQLQCTHKDHDYNTNRGQCPEGIGGGATRTLNNYNVHTMIMIT